MTSWDLIDSCGAPLLHPIREWAGNPLPDDYIALFKSMNGFVCHGGAFRFLAMPPSSQYRDVVAWNARPWRSLYFGECDDSFVFAEDVYGDQYFFHPSSGEIGRLIAEGGTRQFFDVSGVDEFLNAYVLVPADDCVVDVPFYRQAVSGGLNPSVFQHLSFELPLVCGGSYDLPNVEVMDAEAHLQFLGQIVKQTSRTGDGVQIRSFRESD